MAVPKNKALYSKVKAEVYKRIPKHSAYRSGILVKEYKKRGGTYSGEKPKGGLTRWFKEEWRTQYGRKTFNKKSDIFRPTKRITSKTPTTMSELSKKRISKARKEKAKTGKVKKY